MKQKHMLDFTTLQILFSEWSYVKHVLAADSVSCRRTWLCLFHWCSEILVRTSGFPFCSWLSLASVAAPHAPLVPAPVGLAWSSWRGSAASECSSLVCPSPGAWLWDADCAGSGRDCPPGPAPYCWGLCLGGDLLMGGRASGGWVAVRMGMQRLATCTLLPALYLKIITLLWWHRPCCVQNQTLRFCPRHWLLPSLSLLFLFSKIPVCPHSPLPLNSIWATAMCSGLQMAAGIFNMC